MHTIREAWLQAATLELLPLFRECGELYAPSSIRVACGFPSIKGTSAKNRRIGECWDASASSDATTEIFISPTLDDPIEVLGVLTHELIHATIGVDQGHKGPFRKLATSIGLEGKMTATVVGENLKHRLNAISTQLGKYPHASLNITSSPRKKQSTRLLKAECPQCGYVIRVTAKWVEVGLPVCQCGEKFATVG